MSWISLLHSITSCSLIDDDDDDDSRVRLKRGLATLVQTIKLSPWLLHKPRMHKKLIIHCLARYISGDFLPWNPHDTLFFFLH